MKKTAAGRVADVVGQVLGTLLAVWLLGWGAVWVFAHPHGPYFWLRVLAVVFGLPFLAWVGLGVMLYGRTMVPWFFAPGQRWRQVLGVVAYLAVLGAFLAWLVAGR